MTSIKELKAAQDALRKAMLNLQSEVKHIIEEVPPLSGVTVQSKSICTVSLSNLRNTCLDPAYYNPDTQAKAVLSALNKPGMSYDQFTKTLDQLVTNKATVYNGGKVRLNENMLKALITLQTQLA